MEGAILKEKATEVYKRLRKAYPNARIELHFNSPVQLLVATILSAQCTDARVNEVTERLFTKYQKPQDYLRWPLSELEQDIRATGFFRQKGRSLQGVMKALVEKHGGQVPAELEALTALPGVGRKTANVILGNAFGIPGIVVDTHVSRVTQRIGLTRETDPERIERDLSALYPREEWTRLSHTLIFHGRYTCKAKKPLCQSCVVSDLCDYFAAQSAG